MSSPCEIVSPAPFLASRALFDAMIRAKPLAARVATYQLARGDTHGILDGDNLLGVIGFWPIAPDALELFMGLAPAERVAPRAMAVQRAGRLIVRRRMQDATVARIVAWVSSGASPGGRLARAAGLRVAAYPAAAPVLMEWTR